MTLNLHEYRWVVLNSSAGKDSQAMLSHVVETADAQGYPRDRILVVHCDLGKSEWEGTKDLAKLQAEFYGLRFLVVHRRKQDGTRDTLLEYAKRRGKWPSSKQRWCTSDFKRAPVGPVFTSLGDGIKILNCLGMRAQESPARSKMLPFEVNDRYTNSKRSVHNWLPIHDWTVEQVWAKIRESGVPHHYAYDLGMPRLSCCFCIFSPRAALLLAGKLNPELLKEYVTVEKEIGHTFREKQSLAEIQDALDRGERPQKVVDWVM